MRYRLLPILFCLGMFLSLNAQEHADPVKDFLNELESKTSTIQTITCKFKQTQSLSVLSEKVTKSGVFYYRRPERILLSFSDGDYIKMTPDIFQMRNGEQVNQIKVASNPMLNELKKILSACMTGQVMKSGEDFEYTLKEEALTYTVKMTPKKRRVSSKIKEITLEFDRKDMCLSKMMMVRPNGDYTLYEFLDKELKTPINQLDER